MMENAWSLWPLCQAWGADSNIAPAGNIGELNATGAGGIDLYLERRKLLIGVRPGRAIAINGSIPGPVIRMIESKKALIRVHNHLPESIHSLARHSSALYHGRCARY